MAISSDARAMMLEQRRRPLKTPEPEVHRVTASDGVALRLTRYRGGARGPVLLAHGLAVSSRIFSTDTIATNLVEYLCAHGFDVWLFDNRVSIDLPASEQPWTGDDVATRDFPAAIATIRYVTGATQVDAIVHCYGATTFFMSMLAGLQGVRSIVCSQVATHVSVPWRPRAESWIRLASLLRVAGVPAMSARPIQGTPLHRAYDAALGLVPMPPRERCKSAACRRVSFLFGRLYQHDQLDPVTHEALHELFGVASIVAFEHLSTMFRHGRVVTAAGRDEYLPYISRLALPITFIHGALNACYLPQTTATTFELLSNMHARSLYERHVVPNYGHIDCIFGKNAVRDVYPLMLRHFDRLES